MKIESHLAKIRRFKQTIAKLDLEDDYETLIEDYIKIEEICSKIILKNEKEPGNSN